MALAKCKACEADISTAAAKCPRCGQPLPTTRGPAAAFTSLLTLILIGAALWWLLGGGIEHKVANDVTDQYYIAKRQGDKMQICVAAGLVAAAYLQAKDDNNYRAWKDTEAGDCRAAGLPR